MLKNHWNFFYLLPVAVLILGCVPPQDDTDFVIASESEKIAKIQLGMTVADVKSIMGTDKIVFSQGYGKTYESRPIRVDKFTDKSGSPIDVYFYRSSLKRQDGACSDDETTAIIFLSGKVDAITSGDASKTVIEVRRR